MRVLRAVLATALVTASATAVVAAPAAATPTRHTALKRAAATPAVTRPPGTYVPVTPFRAADTRKSSPLAAGKTLKVAIGGHGSVPSSNVAAVALTVSALSPTASGVLAVYAYGATRPATRSVSYTARANASATVVSRVSSGGALTVYNWTTTGKTDVVVDVTGYWTPAATARTSGTLRPLGTPGRVLDTPHNGGAIGKGATKTVTFGGHNGVPTSLVGAVLVSITAVNPAAAGGLTAVSHGNDPPAPWALRMVKGQTNTAFAVVATDDQGRIDLKNISSATLQLYIDLVAWVPAGPAAEAGTVQTRYPQRVLNGSALAGGRTTSITVAGKAGVPLTGVASVIASLTAYAPARAGGLVAWNGAAPTPAVTSLQFNAGGSAANLTTVAVSSKGTISVHNSSTGSTKLYVDIVGYVPASTIAPPASSTSRYIRTAAELTGRFAATDNTGEGYSDAVSGSKFVLLQFGAQLNDKSGVQLTGTAQDEVSYGDLVNAIDGYLTSYASYETPDDVTVALGTNNSGDFTKFSATDRGKAWASQVVDAVAAPVGVTVVGANDIEESFSGTYQNGIDWENGFLSDPGNHDLIFNGSADGCDTAYGHTGEKCSYWTMAEIYRLAGGLSPRIKALPQIYNAGMAAQWTNIVATGGVRSGYFAGVLTQSQVCQATPTDPVCVATYTPSQGWEALYRGLSTVSKTPDLPAVTDLRADSS